MLPRLEYTAQVCTESVSQGGGGWRECSLVRRHPLTRDTDLYYVRMPAASRMHVPLGSHVFLRPSINNAVTSSSSSSQEGHTSSTRSGGGAAFDADDLAMLAKPYTVVDNDELLKDTAAESNNTNNNNNNNIICLIIKHYDDGVLTPILRKLLTEKECAGEEEKSKSGGCLIEMSVYAPNSSNRILTEPLSQECQELVLICAGTGLTPMLRLLSYALNLKLSGDRYGVYSAKDRDEAMGEDYKLCREDNEHNIQSILMLDFNKTQADIICRAELDACAQQHAKK
jgi:hypothetical protein